MDTNRRHAETNVDNTLLDTVRDRLKDARVADSQGTITSKHFHEVDNAISEALGQLELFGRSDEPKSQASQLKWTARRARIPDEEDLASVHHKAIEDFEGIIQGHTGPLEKIMLQPSKYAQLTSVFPGLGDADIRQILASAQAARETGQISTPQPASGTDEKIVRTSPQNLNARKKLATGDDRQTPRSPASNTPTSTKTPSIAKHKDTCYQLDREALLALYWSSGGPRWKHAKGWVKNSADVEGWIGVSLNEKGRVSKIDLSRNGLEGTIPAALGRLNHLTHLRLSFNSFTGPIPATFGNLSQLSYLDIGSNQITGSLPAALGRLANLNKMDLSNNLLDGFIPPEFGGMKKLQVCWLENNHIQGPIPPEMADIPSLTDLDLAENRLEVRRLQGQSLTTWRANARDQLGKRMVDGFTGSRSQGGSIGGGDSRREDLEGKWNADRPTGVDSGEGSTVADEEALLSLMAKDKEIAALRAEVKELRWAPGADPGDQMCTGSPLD